MDIAGGRGVCEKSILLHKLYLVKWSTNGGGGQKSPKKLSTWFMDDPYVHKSDKGWKYYLNNDVKDHTLCSGNGNNI